MQEQLRLAPSERVLRGAHSEWGGGVSGCCWLAPPQRCWIGKNSWHVASYQGHVATSLYLVDLDLQARGGWGWGARRLGDGCRWEGVSGCQM